MRKFCYCLAAIFALQLALVSAWAAKEDCGDPPNPPAKPVEEVGEDDLNVNNDYDEVVEESIGAGYYYLTVINGDTPKPNKCGLNPSNDAGAWTGWGGPLNGDNVTIGEGAGSRNEIVIGGTYFPRGIGTHAPATFEYDLSGMDYARFECYVGMSDEKDAGLECGHGGSGDFVFEVDGKEMFASEVLKGSDGAGNNQDAVKVEFNIPSGASTLTIIVGDGGDGNSCDHSCLGDPKLMTSGAGAVEPGDKAATVWGGIKASY
jgi:hypothetical protein